jgi:penicillin-binding protein 1C
VTAPLPAAEPRFPSSRGRVARGIITAVGAFLAVALAAIALVPLPARLDSPGSAVVLYRDDTTAHVFLSDDDKWRIPVALERVDPDYVTALVALEDSRFYAHPGVDPIAIVRAVGQNAAARHTESGASTLTMQLARLTNPRPRTLTSKVLEAMRAVQLEARLSKAEILERYLTFVPYGRNVEGIEAASLAYFGHSADALSAAEIATLLAVPQDPNGRYPTAAHRDTLKTARDDIAARLLADGALPTDGQPPEAVLATVEATPIPEQLRPLPQDAPHAARWLRRRAAGSVRVRTTLDRDVQHLAEQTLAASREDSDRNGIHNASMVVVDHATGAVRGLVGNFDFWDDDHGGQIAGFDVPRSPGSALKPFIYAAAIDRGLILPDWLVPDVPVRYGDYAPENFDGGWTGEVRAEDALSRSLNIPFIELLQRVGVEPFLGDLRALGATHLDPRPGHYGLSVAAGGIELTPLEMAGLYTALAEDGRPRTLAFTPDELQPPGPHVTSEGAAWLTRRALRLRDRPDFPTRRQFSKVANSISWKTGTSFGWRDAWAIGSGATYTAAVWMGNFDNSGTTRLVGAEAAAPVLFDLMGALGEDRATLDDPAPGELVPVEVCSLSGRLATDACPDRRQVLARADRVPTARCALHVSAEIDDATGLAVRPGCREGRATHTEVHVEWPSAVRRYLSDQFRAQSPAPALDPACDTTEHAPPRILSPGDHDVVLLIPGMDAESQEVPFEAEADDADALLSWFVDGTLVGKAPADERVWWTPIAGEHVLVVMDGAGGTTRRKLLVRGG